MFKKIGEFMAIPKEGNKAPDFKLMASNGKEVSLKDYAGKSRVVLYFYPHDDTPGCTKEACTFRDCLDKFNKKRAVILFKPSA